MTQSTVPGLEQGLSEAYGQLRRGLLSTIRRRVHDPQLAEDLLQDVFVKAVQSIREHRAPGNLPAWLYRVVQTTLVDHYRAKRLVLQPLDDEPAAEEPEDRSALHALATCMQPLARTLPPIYRDALVAADFQGQRLAVQAAAGHVSVSAIKSRVSRARAMLRDRLLACCDVETDSHGRVEDFRPRAGVGCTCVQTKA